MGRELVGVVVGTANIDGADDITDATRTAARILSMHTARGRSALLDHITAACDVPAHEPRHPRCAGAWSIKEAPLT